MALAIIDTPDVLNAARRPIIFTMSSDRNTPVIITEVSSITDGTLGGIHYCTYNKVGIDTVIKVGDVVIPSLFSAYYNVRQNVISVGLNYITTDLLYETGAVMTGGTVTTSNDDFKIRCTVTISTSVTTVYRTIISGVATLDVSKFCADYLTYKIYSVGAATQLIVGGYKNVCATIDVSFIEYWNNAANILTISPDAEIKNNGYYAIDASREHIENTTLDTNYIFQSGLFTQLFLTKQPRVTGITDKTNMPVLAIGDTNYLSFFVDSAIDNYIASFTVFNAVGVDVETYIFPTNIQMGYHYGICPVSWANVVTTPLAGYTLSVYIYNNTAAQRSSETYYYQFVDKTREPSYMLLMYKNSFGAWDHESFYYDYEVQPTTSKKTYERKLSHAWAKSDRAANTFGVTQSRRFKIKSKLMTVEKALHLEELDRSEEVYLLSGSDWLPLSNCKCTLPIILKNDAMIQVSFEADYYNII